MSRLYEALKGANRTRKVGSAGDSLWEALDFSSKGVSTDAPAAEQFAESTPVLLDVNSQEEPAGNAATSAREVKRQELGTSTKAGLDQTARLLPHSANPALADHYRRLRTKILQQRDQKPFRSLVVTSAAPQEGKSVTVMNLALSFSSLPDFKVLVVDGDLRKGTLGKWLAVSDNQPGLSNLLCGTASLEDVVLKSDQVPMHFMVAGTEEIHDLHPTQFAGHFQKLSDVYDLVLIDSPPVNLLADVQLLAANADAVLLVARAFSTTKKSLEKAAQELAPFRVIGSVLNAGVQQRAYRYYGNY